MDNPALQAIMAVAIYSFLHVLPFLAFGIFLFGRLRKTSILFIIYSASLVAWRVSAENKQIALNEMFAAGIPTEEVAVSWQMWLPLGLLAVSTALLFTAFISLAVAIRGTRPSQGVPQVSNQKPRYNL